MFNLMNKIRTLMSFITANYESDVVSMYLQPMMHASIFWIPPCIQVIIQKSVMLFCTAHIVADFHVVGGREPPIR